MTKFLVKNKPLIAAVIFGCLGYFGDSGFCYIVAGLFTFMWVSD